MKNGENTLQCGSNHTHCGSVQPHWGLSRISTISALRRIFPEPSADALGASADEPSRTQNLADFRNFRRSQSPPAVRVSHTHYHPHRQKFESLNKETYSQCGWVYPQCGCTWAASARNFCFQHGFYFWRIMNAVLTVKIGQGSLRNNPNITPTHPSLCLFILGITSGNKF